MEQIKESFKHDFNLAVKSFNEKDYKSFVIFVQQWNCWDSSPSTIFLVRVML